MFLLHFNHNFYQQRYLNPTNHTFFKLIFFKSQPQKLPKKQKHYELYYSLIHILKWKLFELEIFTDSSYFVLNFYQINKNDEARTHDEISNFGVLDPNKSI
jgi:hypothetical protein